MLILARYTEVIENIYARNTFVTVQLNSFLCFSGSILPQRLDIITSIWFAYHVESRRQPDRNPFSKIASSRRELPMWERTCSVLANMKHLCDLRMAVKAPSRYTPIQGEAILAPLMAAKQVRTFLTDVSWPLDHEKGRGDVPYRLRQLPSP